MNLSSFTRTSGRFTGILSLPGKKMTIPWRFVIPTSVERTLRYDFVTFPQKGGHYDRNLSFTDNSGSTAYLSGT